MATTNFYLKYASSNEETLIYFTLTVGNNRFKFSTQKKIHPKFWDAVNQRPKKSYTGAPELKSYLKTLEGDANRIYTQFQALNRPFTLEQVKRKLAECYERKPKENAVTLFSFIEQYINSVTPHRSKSTIKAYRNTLNNLKEYQTYTGGKKIDFDSINLDFYNDYTEYLMNVKGFANNTIGNNIKNLKVFLNEATERGLNTKLDFKSRRFKKLAEEADSIYLSEEELTKLFNLDLSDKLKLQSVRDLFIVGCYTGLRFSDFSQLSSENIKNGFINVKTQKTDEPVVIPIHPRVKQVLSRYKNITENSLPRAISNQKMNEYLKEIGRLAGLLEQVTISSNKGGKRISQLVAKFELISTHTARRSFATNLYLQGFPSISIMKITGHKTEKAFLKYIKMSAEENANKLLAFWQSQSKLKVV